MYKSDESIVIFALFRQLLLSLQFILSTRLKYDFDLIFLRNLKVKTKRDYALRDITLCALYYFVSVEYITILFFKYNQYVDLGSSYNIRKGISFF